MKLRKGFSLSTILMVVVATSLHAQQWPNRQPGFGQQGQQQVQQGAPLQRGEDPGERLGFDQVRWSGSGLDSLEPLKGKTVLLFVYSSSCPKCNEWSGELFKQLMEATKDRPVVILAINAEEKRRPSLRYVRQRGFGAPNIVHGYDPNMPARLGFSSNLFQCAWIDPEGRVKDQGSLGAKLQAAAEGDAGQEVFVLVKKLQETTNLGRFKLLQPGMSPGATSLLWPVELGQPLTSMTLSKVRRMLKKDQKEGFDKAVDKYLDEQLAQIKKLAAGDVPSRFKAYDLAEAFVKSLRSVPQAKEVRKVLDTLKKDRDFKNELAAMRIYEKATAESVPPQRRLGMLRNLVKRYKDTYYAQKASEELPAE